MRRPRGGRLGRADAQAQAATDAVLLDVGFEAVYRRPISLLLRPGPSQPALTQQRHTTRSRPGLRSVRACSV
ncbi:hypothetical protein ACFVXC_38065, partial [Streptomyces sp. NPDC058257]|uniref:hypothetical protein n=1 Tax=Streptomyces sp. NPDC058257 TaxID=3346409 RepID=UPI0036E13123